MKISDKSSGYGKGRLILLSVIKKKQNLICIILGVMLALSLIPIFIVADYDAAAGDDYNYGAAAHQAFLATGSVIASIKAAWGTTVSIWYGWQGTWFDCFVFCLHPEVFSDRAYVIVPFIFLAMHFVGFLFLTHHFLVERWKFSGNYWLQIGLIYLLFEIQLVPSQKSAFFWWVGCVHYVMPMLMTILGIVWGDRFLMEHKAKDYVLLLIISALMGGVTYPAALLLPISVFLLWLADFVLGGKRDKRNALLLIPLAELVIGLIISMIAPGNKVRSASDIGNGAEPANGIIDTIVSSFTMSVNEAATVFIGEKGFALIALLLIIPITIVAFGTMASNFVSAKECEDIKKAFSHPILFVVVMFCLNASVYAPRVYAGGIVSSGYVNFNFWTFLSCIIATEIYLIGWGMLVAEIGINKRIVGRKEDDDNGSAQENNVIMRVFSCTVLVLLTLIIAFAARHGVKKYTDYVCLEYYLSGQADDYKEQIELQRRILNSEGSEAVVPEINNEQGPLMQMPIVSDPENVNNYMAKIFYGKEKVWAIPRNEWIELYGEEYGIKQ